MTGVVKAILFDLSPSCQSSLPIAVIVEFNKDAYVGPNFPGLPLGWVPINPETAVWTEDDDISTVHSRTQIPFSLAWASTVHKSQGQTLLSAVVKLSKYLNKNALLFVALSRVQEFEQLLIDDFPCSDLLGINQSPALKDRTYEESRIQEMARKTLLWIESFLLQKQENRATPQLPSLAFSNRPSKCKKIALQLKRNRNEPLTMPCTTKINASFATASLQAFEAAYQTQLGLLVCHKKPHSQLNF